MIKKILVPTDHSEASLNALNSAIHIARANNAVIQILHIAEPGSQEAAENEKESQDLYATMGGSVFQTHAVKTEIIFAEGIPGPVIIKAVDEKKPDLIVMGAHGISDKDQVIGSTTYFVLQHAESPVLIIPEEGNCNNFQTVLYPVRPDRHLTMQLEKIRNISSLKGKPCRYEIFTILGKKQSHDAELISNVAAEVERQMTGEEQIKLSLTYNTEGSIPEQVFQKASTIDPDLLILSPSIDMAHKPHYARIFLQQIITLLKIPVLSMYKISG